LLAFLLGAFLAVANTITNFLSGQLIDEWEYGRYSGGGQNAVELALILSLCFPVAWHLAITQQASRLGTLLKTICYGFIPIAFFALILTASRTALFAVIPFVIYIIGSLSRFKPIYRILGFFIFIIAVFVGQSFIPSATLERLETIGSSITSGDLGGRMDLWKQSLQIFLEHPLLGIGSGALAAPDQLGAFAHNTFISILTELGIIGFLLFLGILVSAFYQVVKQPKPTSYLWLTVLLIWIIGVQSLTWEYTKPTWFFLGMIAISAGVVNRRNTLNEVQPISKYSRVGKDIVRTRLPWLKQFPQKSTTKSNGT